MVQGLGAHGSTRHLNIPPAARLDLVKITSEVSCAMHAGQCMQDSACSSMLWTTALTLCGAHFASGGGQKD